MAPESKDDHKIVVFCNPLLDVSIEVDSMDYLNKYGIKLSNAILAHNDIHQ